MKKFVLFALWTMVKGAMAEGGDFDARGEFYLFSLCPDQWKGSIRVKVVEHRCWQRVTTSADALDDRSRVSLSTGQRDVTYVARLGSC